MKWKRNLAALFIACFLLQASAFGQGEQFRFKRTLSGIDSTWHKLILPDSLFGKLSYSMDDLRIRGVNPRGDTVEAPYLLRTLKEEIIQKHVPFTILNQSSTPEGYFYTFKLSEDKAINQVQLNFADSNFDWRVKLEGSNDQKEWFTVIDDYRILSISNAYTQYHFTRLQFPLIQYAYLRLRINSQQHKPTLLSAYLHENQVSSGVYKQYPPVATQVQEDKKQQKTVMSLTLPLAVPVSYLRLKVKNRFDFYRPVSISYLSDSIETQKGWKYHYRPLFTGSISSLETNEYKFDQVVTKQLRVEVINHDNEALQFATPEIKGSTYELVARFVQPASYFLLYGSENSRPPAYDIASFENKLPQNLRELQLGPEIKIQQHSAPPQNPLFNNVAWLWAILLLIMLLLGWFSIKMIKKSNEPANVH